MQRSMEVLIWTKPEQAVVLQAAGTAATCGARAGFSWAEGRSQSVATLFPWTEQRCPRALLGRQWMLGPTVARETPSQGTSPSHSSGSSAQASVSIKQKPLLHILGCKQASILNTSVSYAGRGQNYIESYLEGKSCLLTLRVFSHKQTPQIPSSKNNAT